MTWFGSHFLKQHQLGWWGVILIASWYTISPHLHSPPIEMVCVTIYDLDGVRDKPSAFLKSKWVSPYSLFRPQGDRVNSYIRGYWNTNCYWATSHCPLLFINRDRQVHGCGVSVTDGHPTCPMRWGLCCSCLSKYCSLHLCVHSMTQSLSGTGPMNIPHFYWRHGSSINYY